MKKKIGELCSPHKHKIWLWNACMPSTIGYHVLYAIYEFHHQYFRGYYGASSNFSWPTDKRKQCRTEDKITAFETIFSPYRPYKMSVLTNTHFRTNISRHVQNVPQFNPTSELDCLYFHVASLGLHKYLSTRSAFQASIPSHYLLFITDLTPLSVVKSFENDETWWEI